ncbi:hypothetical protein D9619_013440 [Psilocybe cf. subviscida]|uniref:NAD(P)-binding protein n=1 Tax=Psilocybe cf. subviscida TaxID=2480587 RepID=A0A8H5BTD8_9AGAR|nr:hypothetical protein D9619_013440 [Psilocybe cf. subviscida]
MTSNTPAKVWLVTGAGTGLGKAVVEHALAKGDKVSATARKTALFDDLVAKYPSSQLIVVKLDVTSTAEISAAFAKTVEAFGRVDVVYNNAAQAVFGEVEGANEDSERRYFDVNFWGATNVSKEAVRVFRDVNKPAGGRLLQASSIVGVNAMPILGFYSASKWAFEGISEALSKELDPSWNIRINILVIGGFNTGVLDKVETLPIPAVYEALPETAAVKATRAYLASGFKPEGDPAKAARAIFEISRNDEVETLRIPLGKEALQVIGERIEQHKAVLEKAGKYSDDLRYTE